MYRKIMVPVDLAHIEDMSKAIKVALETARRDNAEVVFVGVTGTVPGVAAHTPEEFRAKLHGLAVVESAVGHVRATDHMVISHDPRIDLRQRLLDTVTAIDADLVVMATHRPEEGPQIFTSSNGGFIAAHAPVSVYVIRK